MSKDYAVVTAITDGQGKLSDTQACPKSAIEYKLNNVFIGPVKNSDSSWLYLQTTENKCGTFKISVWYKEPRIDEQVIILPECTLELYRKLPTVFVDLFPKMELIGEYAVEWDTKETFVYEGVAGYFKGNILIDLKYDEFYGNDNLYYMQYQAGGLPCKTFEHKIEGYQDEISMRQVALWVRETPLDCYPYYTNSIEGKGAVDKIIFLDRTLVGYFRSALDSIVRKIVQEKLALKTPITTKDAAITVVSAVITEVAKLDFFSGIVVSLLVTGVAGIGQNNVIREQGEKDFLGRITEILDKNAKPTVDEGNGSTYSGNDIGLKLTLRTKMIQCVNTREDTDSVEIWGPGMNGREYVKLIKGPLFYKGKFYVDDQLFIEGKPAISYETIADIFGWTEYLELAKREKANG